MVFKNRNNNVSYAVIQPPRVSEAEFGTRQPPVPVLIVLHGAGVEAESQQTREMLKSMGDIQAWVIVPTGGSKWGADDWRESNRLYEI